MLCKPLSPATFAAGTARYAAYSDPNPNPNLNPNPNPKHYPNPNPTPNPNPDQARYAAYSESAATMVHVEALQARYLVITPTVSLRGGTLTLP